MMISILGAFGLMGVLSASTPPASESFFKRHAEGWHFYKDVPVPDDKKKDTEKPKKEEEKPTKKEVPPPQKSPTARIKEQQKKGKFLLHQAILEPTMENIRAYQTYQKEVLAQSQRFSEGWQKSLIYHPWLDETALNPANQAGINMTKEMHAQRKEALLKKYSKEWGLFYVFRKSCGYCQGFSEVLTLLSKKVGWSILAISLDGSKHDTFQTVPDNGVVKKLKITITPALVAVHPQTQKVVPLLYGYHTLDEVEERLYDMLKGEKP